MSTSEGHIDGEDSKYVLLEVEKGFPILPGSKFSSIGLDKEKPVFKLLDNVYTGSLNEIPGSFLVYENTETGLKEKYKVTKMFKLQRIDRGSNVVAEGDIAMEPAEQ